MRATMDQPFYVASVPNAERSKKGAKGAKSQQKEHRAAIGGDRESLGGPVGPTTGEASWG